MASLVHRSWYSPISSSPLLPLLPFLYAGSKLYELGLTYDRDRERRHRRALPAPVISVGNITTGGTGKTPLTIWLARHFASMGKNPAILSRGYGRRGKDVSRVPTDGNLSDCALHFGDEPTLMAKHLRGLAGVWVGRDRWLSGRKAIQSGADILLMDDGFQHLRLYRDLDLVLVDAHKPFGNGALLPLGPLREPASSLNRADAIIVTRADDPAAAARTIAQMEARFPGKPVFTCRHKLMGPRFGLDGPLIPPPRLHGYTLVAFAGIGKPKQFFDSLYRLGLHISEGIAYPDHYRYGRKDLVRLIHAGRGKDPLLFITTEKDFVRLPAPFQRTVLTAAMEMDFGSDHAAFCNFLENIPSS